MSTFNIIILVIWTISIISNLLYSTKLYKKNKLLMESNKTKDEIILSLEGLFESLQKDMINEINAKSETENVDVELLQKIERNVFPDQRFN